MCPGIDVALVIDMTPWLTATLPQSRTRAAWTIALFAAVQVADAALTMTGIARFGVTAEANPILSFYMATFGVGRTLVAAKCIVIALAATLHLRAHHLLIAVLILIYVSAAICPWSWLLVT